MPGHLSRGHLAGGRYRLEAELGQSADGTGRVWRAVDQTLERGVALRFFDAAADRVRLLERAAVAASLTHPRIVRIFDTGFDGGQFFTVSELLPGSLSWAKLPLEEMDALRTGVQIAEALAYAHERGVAHGSLHTGNVLLGEQGAKVADFGLAADDRATPRRDLVQLGDLLRTVGAAGPSGAASKVVSTLRAGGYPDARAALHDLQALLPTEPDHRRTRALPFIAGAVLILVGVAGFAATRLGPRRPATPPPAGQPVEFGPVVQIRGGTDFDPDGDDRTENRRTVPRAFDGDPRTFWATERYRAGPRFPLGKRGVGITLDLGTERRVGAVRIVPAREGCALEIRSAGSPSGSLEDWEVAVALAADAPKESAFDPVRARHWLVWVTALGRIGRTQTYDCRIAEVDLFEPA